MENLRRKPTYNELINYLEFEQPKIKYPNRNATFLRNSPYLSQFDGDSWIDLEEQENNINKEKLKEMEVRRLASDAGRTAQALRSSKTTSGYTTPMSSEIDSHMYDVDPSLIQFIDDVDDERNELQQRANIRARNIASMWHDMAANLYNQEMKPIPPQLRTRIDTEELPPLEDIPEAVPAEVQELLRSKSTSYFKVELPETLFFENNSVFF